MRSPTRGALSALSRSCIAIAAIAIGQPSVLAQLAPANERAITKKELTYLYEGKSWYWSDGIGYFASKGQFSAFAGSGKDRTAVKGDWEVLDGGRLCFAGVSPRRESEKCSP